ncbi:thermonuclease family protein [Siculibacillus lacustris]|uniref:Thermonuclease family protein n=1 Tax=Siculibacillus lacustris TaxID=1549641 RepID=A0A4Q9VWX3_9HYPH|nr:thermonuclease family protein [Siculibacillus lacustris]
MAPAARAEPCVVGTIEPVWVDHTPSGDEVVLVDGRRVRLASVEAPRPPLTPPGAGGAAGPSVAAIAAAVTGARAALAEAVEGREIGLIDLGEDRHGRRRGHLLDEAEGRWIEADLVAAGWLRVVPGRDDRPCAAALLGPEGEAIAARRGAWGAAFFAVRAADDTDLAAIVGSYAVVEGRVVSIGHSGGRTFLNFGPDFRRDFAVVLNDKDLERLKVRGFDAASARGRRVRVRGVVDGRGAPRITVEVPEEIELVTR